MKSRKCEVRMGGHSGGIQVHYSFHEFLNAVPLGSLSVHLARALSPFTFVLLAMVLRSANFFLLVGVDLRLRGDSELGARMPRCVTLT